MSERINTTMPDELRDRFEAWRADQYKKTGRIPSLADGARILLHKGLVAEGFKTAPDKKAGSAAEKVFRNEREGEAFRDNMVKVAALALAAIEAHDAGYC